MFETTREFFNDAVAMRQDKVTPTMLDIVLSLTGSNSAYGTGRAIWELHQLACRERIYIACVLLERDQDQAAWQAEWSKLESEAFE